MSVTSDLVSSLNPSDTHSESVHGTSLGAMSAGRSSGTDSDSVLVLSGDTSVSSDGLSVFEHSLGANLSDSLSPDSSEFSSDDKLSVSVSESSQSQSVSRNSSAHSDSAESVSSESSSNSSGNFDSSISLSEGSDV